MDQVDLVRKECHEGNRMTSEHTNPTVGSWDPAFLASAAHILDKTKPTIYEIENSLIEWSKKQNEPYKLTPYQLRSISAALHKSLKREQNDQS